MSIIREIKELSKQQGIEPHTNTFNIRNVELKLTNFTKVRHVHSNLGNIEHILLEPRFVEIISDDIVMRFKLNEFEIEE